MGHVRLLLTELNAIKRFVDILPATAVIVFKCVFIVNYCSTNTAGLLCFTPRSVRLFQLHGGRLSRHRVKGHVQVNIQLCFL